jgi:hypothetical protein
MRTTHLYGAEPSIRRWQSLSYVFTRAHHWSLSSARWIQFIPHHPNLRSILILFSHLRLGLPSGLFPSGYMHSSSPHVCYIPCTSHPPLLDNSNYTLWRVQVMKLLIMQFSQTSYHFISLQSKYSPQHPDLKCFQSLFLPQCQRQSNTPIQNYS